MGELTRHLRRCDVFGSLTVDQIDRLRESCRIRKYPRDSSVYLPQDDSRMVLLLATGRAKLSHITVAGKHSILLFLQPGDLFGEMAVCDSGERDEYCETISDSTIITIPAADLRQLMRENADLSLAMTSLIGQRRRYVERRLKSILFSTTRQKLSRILLDLARDYGEPAATGSGNGFTTAAIRLTVPLSHQELGNLIGATRETVTITLGHLRKENLIHINRRIIVLTDPAALRRTLSSDPDH